MKNKPEGPREHVGGVLEPIVGLHEAWAAAEPNQGYAAKAAEWRTKLPGEKAE